MVPTDGWDVAVDAWFPLMGCNVAVDVWFLLMVGMLRWMDRSH